MVRQARSEATRRKIIDAAMDLFGEVGYPATALSDIIERAELTTGAFYFHFDSKESLASAIIEEGTAAVGEAFRNVGESSSPALENLIHGMFVVADLFVGDKLACTAAQLTRELGEFNGAASRIYGGWLAAMTAQTRQASAEGDVRADVESEDVGEAIISVMLGATVMSDAASGGGDLIGWLIRTWAILLPAIATAESLPYFREFLAREALRCRQPTLSIG